MWYSNLTDKEVTFFTVNESEEKALQEMNRLTDKFLTHNGQATELYELSHGEVIAIGHFSRDKK